MEAVAGMGWLHYYVNGDGDQNSWSTRLGLNFNFNLGESKAWTLGIKPAIVYDMQGTFILRQRAVSMLITQRLS